MSAVEEPSATGAPGAEDTRAELDRVRAERDAVAAKLDRRAERKARGGRIRGAVVLVMVALTIVLIPLTATVTWAHPSLTRPAGNRRWGRSGRTPRSSTRLPTRS